MWGNPYFDSARIFAVRRTEYRIKRSQAQCVMKTCIFDFFLPRVKKTYVFEFFLHAFQKILQLTLLIYYEF
jgi:hypothetical protein